MLFNWLDATEAVEAGTALADAVHLGSASGGRNDPEQLRQKLMQQVDRAIRPLKLNVFKRARLAHSFKWRLLEKGMEAGLVERLTQALVMRLTAGKPAGAKAQAASGAGAEPQHGRRDVGELMARAEGLLVRKEYAAAIEAYAAVLESEPRNASARVNLAQALFCEGRVSEAEAELRHALAIRPNYPEAHCNLGMILLQTARYGDAEQSLRRALKLKPAFADAHLNLGIALTFLGRLRDAQGSFEKVLRVAPRNAAALIGLGRIHAVEGRFGEAEALLKRALEIDPHSPRAWASLIELRRMTPADAAWLKGAEASVQSGVAPLDEASVRFAIGKYYDDTGDFERAFRSYRRGNELMKTAATPYDPQARARTVDDLIRIYPGELLSRAHAGASDSPLPVLVTGMPRSGTSLIEQIIASHPQARGAGELEFWSRAAHKHRAALEAGPPSADLTRNLVAGYLRELGAHSSAAARVVDKATANVDHLGLVHMLFPRARIIYAQRDPIDTCLSCYFQPFSAALGFTTDLEWLADYYRQHQRLMAHWRSALPSGSMLEVPYEELVADQESWTRRILEFIGLAWDPRCLTFQNTERPVATASYWQVRQKIYQSSVSRWRDYRKFIGPLLALR